MRIVSETRGFAAIIVISVGIIASVMSCNFLDRDDRESDDYAIPALAPAGGHEVDRDCGDFNTWREAQDFFERSGSGDPHYLDSDGGGIACETLRSNSRFFEYDRPDVDFVDFDDSDYERPYRP